MRYVLGLLVITFSILSCQGHRGDQGDVGLTGSVGQKGDQGIPGQNPTPVTWLQFCPGTTVYPSTFIEGGFCINGNVYAVYSANNGFLTFLPPGTYNSNAFNSVCSFILLPNCLVQ